MVRNYVYYGILARVVVRRSTSHRFAVTGVVMSGQCTKHARALPRGSLYRDHARMHRLYNLFYDRRTLLPEYLSHRLFAGENYFARDANTGSTLVNLTFPISIFSSPICFHRYS